MLDFVEDYAPQESKQELKKVDSLANELAEYLSGASSPIKLACLPHYENTPIQLY